MSEPIPESIPTSADPRSKRPLKKRALSPRSQANSQVTALFAKPDQEIIIPSSTSDSRRANQSLPPEIVSNVQGSSAGAGSGEFHVYKASRRREYERVRQMEEDVRKEEEGEKWEREKREREERDAEVTRKKREKREKARNKKKGAKAGEKKENGMGGGGIKSRVQIGSKEALGGEGPEKELESSEAKGVEEVGVIIHDDD